MERLRSVQQGIALAIVLVTSSAAAQDNTNIFTLEPLTPRLLPEYVPCIYKDIRYACFDEAQMTELNILEVRARYWHTQWERNVTLAATHELTIKNLDAQIQLHLDMQRQDQDHINVLNERLSSEIEAKNEWRMKAEDPPLWPLWLGGTAAMLGIGAFIGCLMR